MIQFSLLALGPIKSLVCFVGLLAYSVYVPCRRKLDRLDMNCQKTFRRRGSLCGLD